AGYALRIDMTKPKPKDQLRKRGRKSDFRPEYILIAKACARFGAIEDEFANELNIGPATLDRWKQKYPEFRCALKAGRMCSMTALSVLCISARSAGAIFRLMSLRASSGLR